MATDREHLQRCEAVVTELDRELADLHLRRRAAITELEAARQQLNLEHQLQLFIAMQQST